MDVNIKDKYLSRQADVFDAGNRWAYHVTYKRRNIYIDHSPKCSGVITWLICCAGIDNACKGLYWAAQLKNLMCRLPYTPMVHFPVFECLKFGLLT